MAPTATSSREGLLEHPAEAFEAYRSDGVDQVVCEEKHMGSRAVVVVCRSGAVAARRFGFPTAAATSGGVVYTRTGRSFFTNDPAGEAALLDRVRGAVDGAGLWDELSTDWLALDCELMPWSAKAGELLRTQYAPVAASGQAAVSAALDTLSAAAERDVDVASLLDRFRERRLMLDAYAASYGHHCWPVESIDDYRLAPFVVLAGEGAVHATRSHSWHMSVAARLAGADNEGVVVATDYRTVDLSDRLSELQAIEWWETLTAAGGEGMVVKPADAVVASGQFGLVQAGIKCRGQDYLRIVYGPEYSAGDNLARLRQRGLAHKRSLAQREFALGLEALERFVARRPLHQVHECIFGVLALESEPIDPRL
jgi:protein phosphatase